MGRIVAWLIYSSSVIHSLVLIELVIVVENYADGHIHNPLMFKILDMMYSLAMKSFCLQPVI